MYRALGWKVLQAGIDPSAIDAVEQLVSTTSLDLEISPDGGVKILLDDREVGNEIRSPEVSEVTSMISSYSGVRRSMVDRQREFAKQLGAVVEGRDIGTRVFPHTPHKFFLTAPQEVRIARRLEQLRKAGRRGLSQSAIASEITERDQRDASREESPLKLDDSYHLIDTGNASVERVVETIARTVESKLDSSDFR